MRDPATRRNPTRPRLTLGHYHEETTMHISTQFGELLDAFAVGRIKQMADDFWVLPGTASDDPFVGMQTAQVAGFPADLLPPGWSVYAYRNYGARNDGGYQAGWILCPCKS